MPKYKFILKNSSLNVGNVFAYFCEGHRKKIGYNFGAPFISFDTVQEDYNGYKNIITITLYKLIFFFFNEKSLH